MKRALISPLRLKDSSSLMLHPSPNILKEDSSDIPENDPESLWIKQLRSMISQYPEVTIQKNGWFTVKRTGQATKDYILLKVISGSEAIYSEDTVIGVGRWIPRQITLKIEGQHVKGQYPDTSSWFDIL